MGNSIFGEMGFSFPRLYLARGVTTIRTTGALEPYTDLQIRKAIDAGAMPGPKIHVTGPYLEGKGSWAIQMHQLTGPEDATKTVNSWIDQGVDTFKIYNFITSDGVIVHPNEAGNYGVAAQIEDLHIIGNLCRRGFSNSLNLSVAQQDRLIFVRCHQSRGRGSTPLRERQL